MLLELQEIRERLQHVDLKELAQATGLSRMTLHGLANNPNANPTYRVVKLLSEALKNA